MTAERDLGRVVAETLIHSLRGMDEEGSRALSLLQEAVGLAHAAGDPRREAYATAMLGRVHLLRGRLETAAESLDTAIQQAERDRWLAFLPWPQRTGTRPWRSGCWPMPGQGQPAGRSLRLAGCSHP